MANTDQTATQEALRQKREAEMQELKDREGTIQQGAVVVVPADEPCLIYASEHPELMLEAASQAEYVILCGGSDSKPYVYLSELAKALFRSSKPQNNAI